MKTALIIGDENFYLQIRDLICDEYATLFVREAEEFVCVKSLKQISVEIIQTSYIKMVLDVLSRERSVVCSYPVDKNTLESQLTCIQDEFDSDRVETKVKRILGALGFNERHNGYEYLRACATFAYGKEKILTKDIFANAVPNVQANTVERAIRTATDWAIAGPRFETLDKFIGEVKMKNARCSNSFIVKYEGQGKYSEHKPNTTQMITLLLLFIDYATI